MGIPIGWNIAREDPKEKDVLRADITGQRSPIRRRIRSTRSPTSQRAFDTDSLPEPISRSSHARSPLPPPPVPEVSGSAHRSSETAREPPTLLREDANYRQSPWRPRPPRVHLLDARRLRDARRLPALTPGFAPATASRVAEAEALHEAREAAMGPDNLSFRPTSGVRLTRSRSPRAERPSRRSDEGMDGFEDEHETSDNNAVGFPPLRRMGRRNIADGPLPASSLRESWSPVSTVDGLGDRERSMSPYDEQEQLPWDTFLSTVVPDPVAPTAESSFASAAASASFSNSHPSSRAGSSNTSASSSHTHLTVPSQRHSPPTNEFMRACDTSDDDSASDTEAEEDTPLPNPEAYRHRQGPTMLRQRSRPSYFSDEPPQRDLSRYSRRVLERSHDASSYVRSFYNSGSRRQRSLRGVQSSSDGISRGPEHQLDGTHEQPNGPVASDDDVPLLMSMHSPPLDQELREARSLLERLSRREDVSDDFWASVGLTRSFADRVESFNERERL